MSMVRLHAERSLPLHLAFLLSYWARSCWRCCAWRHHLFFFNHTATTETYTLSLHDALPISPRWGATGASVLPAARCSSALMASRFGRDRKSTRLNSSHVEISYAVFCLKKKKKYNNILKSKEEKKKTTEK